MGGRSHAAVESSRHLKRAVWETAADIGPGLLTFTMHFLDPNPGHLLGRFRLSVTTDDRAAYADGLPVGGDVDANWTILTALTVQGPPGMTFTPLPDSSILAGGAISGQGVYSVVSALEVSGVTGIRLEALEDMTLPADGPGYFGNGNFVLTEIELDVAPIPEPSTYALFLAGLVLIAGIAPHARRHKL
jgi:hypothetical protein